MLFNPYVIAGALIILITTFGTGYHLGGKHMKNSIAAVTLEATEIAIVAHEEQAVKDQEIAKEFETVREVVKTVYVKVREKANENIDKNPGYADCSLDDIGLSIFNAYPGYEKNPPGKPVNGVPGSGASDGRKIADDITH